MLKRHRHFSTDVEQAKDMGRVNGTFQTDFKYNYNYNSKCSSPETLAAQNNVRQELTDRDINTTQVNETI